MQTFQQFCESKEKKKLIIMRGISGSGKSTLAKSTQKELGGLIFSTDDFFMQDNQYKFDPKMIGINHQKNQDRTRKAMEDGISPIIIDNTNTQAWEMKAYVDLADEYGYEIIIKQPGDEDFPEVGFDEIMNRQNQRADQNKSLSPDIVRRMLDRFEKNVSIDSIRSSRNPFDNSTK